MKTDHKPHNSMFPAANEQYHTLCSVNEHGAMAHIIALTFKALPPNASQAEIATELCKASNRVAIALEIDQGATPNRDARYMLKRDNNSATAPQLAMLRTVVTLPAAPALPAPANLPRPLGPNSSSCC